MTWYWIVLIFIGYFFGHLITAIICYQTDVTDEIDIAVAMSTLWPIVLQMIIVRFFIIKLLKP